MMWKINKNKIFTGSVLLLLFGILSACNNDEAITKNNYFLSLTGESENWKLHTYEVTITPESMTAGNGMLTMNSAAEYRTDYMNLEFHTIVDGEDKVIQEKTVTGETDISQTLTGTIESEMLWNEDGLPVALETVEEMYMTIQWRDKRKGRMVTEKIDLLNEKPFFN